MTTTSEMHLAARLTFASRDGWEAWLDSASAGPGDVSDWDAMYRGWFFKIQSAVGFEATGGTVREQLHELSSSSSVSALWCRWDDGKGECWVWAALAPGGDGELSAAHAVAECLFAQCRAGVSHLTDEVSLAVYWSSPTGEPEPASVAAVCAMSAHGSEFVDAGGMAEYGLDWQVAMHNTLGELVLWQQAARAAGEDARQDSRFFGV